MLLWYYLILTALFSANASPLDQNHSHHPLSNDSAHRRLRGVDAAVDSSLVLLEVDALLTEAEALAAHETAVQRGVAAAQREPGGATTSASDRLLAGLVHKNLVESLAEQRVGGVTLSLSSLSEMSTSTLRSMQSLVDSNADARHDAELAYEKQSVETSAVGFDAVRNTLIAERVKSFSGVHSLEELQAMSTASLFALKQNTGEATEAAVGKRTDTVVAEIDSEEEEEEEEEKEEEAEDREQEVSEISDPYDDPQLIKFVDADGLEKEEREELFSATVTTADNKAGPTTSTEGGSFFGGIIDKVLDSLGRHFLPSSNIELEAPQESTRWLACDGRFAEELACPDPPCGATSRNRPRCAVESPDALGACNARQQLAALRTLARHDENSTIFIIRIQKAGSSTLEQMFGLHPFPLSEAVKRRRRSPGCRARVECEPGEELEFEEAIFRAREDDATIDDGDTSPSASYTNPRAVDCDTFDKLLHYGETSERYRRDDWNWSPTLRANSKSRHKGQSTPSGDEKTLNRIAALYSVKDTGIDQDCIPFIYSYSYLDRWGCGADPQGHRLHNNFQKLGKRRGHLAAPHIANTPAMSERQKNVTTAFFSRARIVSGHMKVRSLSLCLSLSLPLSLSPPLSLSLFLSFSPSLSVPPSLLLFFTPRLNTQYRTHYSLEFTSSAIAVKVLHMLLQYEIRLNECSLSGIGGREKG